MQFFPGMTSSTRDGGAERLRARRGELPRAHRGAAFVAGALLQAPIWACREHTTKSQGSEPGAVTEGPGSNLESPPPANAQNTGKPTVRSQMLSHYAETGDMRRALVAGKLGAFQAAASSIARDGWGPAETRAWAQRARAAAASAQVAPSLVEAALALGTLGNVCASCHVASQASRVSIAPEEPLAASNPQMLAHAVASDRLWAGLTLPSDDSWASGVQLILQDPSLANPSAEVAPASRLLLDLARRAKRAEPDERGPAFADILLTCAGCHERLGVVLENGVVAR